MVYHNMWCICCINLSGVVKYRGTQSKWRDGPLRSIIRLQSCKSVETRMSKLLFHKKAYSPGAAKQRRGILSSTGACPGEYAFFCWEV